MLSPHPSQRFFATCAPGLEPVLAAELAALRVAHPQPRNGGVAFEGRLSVAWRANLWLRTAGRVLMRLARFRARDGDELLEGARGVPWEELLAPDGTLAVEARLRASRLDHSLYVEQRVKDGVCDRLRARTGRRPSVDLTSPDLRVFAHLSRDRCTLSADTSGAPLYKRGWRVHQGRAPLSESIAAGLVLASGWDRRAPLVDPFCGSATIPIEAALIAAGTAPGSFRREPFGFERWLGHDAAAWRALREAESAPGELPRRLVLVGRDRDPVRLEQARQNVAAAGLEGRIDLEEGDARDRAWRRGWNAWIATNPPWGERVGDRDRALRTASGFGRALLRSCAGYHLALLAGSRELVLALGIPPDRVVEIQNGPVRCGLVLARVPEGGGPDPERIDRAESPPRSPRGSKGSRGSRRPRRSRGSRGDT